MAKCTGSSCTAASSSQILEQCSTGPTLAALGKLAVGVVPVGSASTCTAGMTSIGIDRPTESTISNLYVVPVMREATGFLINVKRRLI